MISFTMKLDMSLDDMMSARKDNQGGGKTTRPKRGGRGARKLDMDERVLGGMWWNH